ncbi:MAG: hypothetical protein L0271_02515 [Gemmatimonadetes bacterium]|nr:hypothetical protein [Gemmatimonadota bacterium]
MVKRYGPALAVLAGCIAHAAATPDATRAQDVAPAVPASALRVFLDCDQCDFDHLRREVTFVDYVRERTEAQVHVLVTTQATGGGGREYTLYYIGLGGFAARQDTVRMTTDRNDTDTEVRDAFTRTFALGLVPFALRAGLAGQLTVRRQEERAEQLRQTPADDPWDLWVFRLSTSATIEGESQERSKSLDGSFSAGRVTEDLKIDFDVQGEYNEDVFEFEDDGEERSVLSVSRDFDLDGLVVWSLGPHLSAGFTVSAMSSTRVNQDLAVEVMPAIEYSLYPYDESTRRQITVTYTIGLVRYDYEELTLFDLLHETRGQQRLEIAAAFQQPWGEIDVSLEGNNYLHDFGAHRLDLFSRFEIRLFRGLSLEIDGSVARIKDQLYIPREDISDAEILLRRRDRGTDYRYELDVGFSFTFGSVFNNVVNPRLSPNRRFN